MKRFIALLCTFVLIFSLAVPAFSDEFDDDDFEQDYSSDNSAAEIYRAIGGLENEIETLFEEMASLSDSLNSMEDSETDPAEMDEMNESAPELGPLLDVQVYNAPLGAMNPVSSSTGLKDVLLDFIGEYDAIIVEYRYATNAQGSYSYVREIQPDYVWLCSCGLLVVMIYCVFKAGGALLCKI